MKTDSPRVYRLTRPLVRAGMRLFFRTIEVQDGARLPTEGPVLLAANHPNSIMDPFALGVATPRTVHFLARSGIFTTRLKSAFLRAAGVVPIYRRQDDPDEVHKNVETFDACFEVLERGGAIGIFPEGVTHTEPRVLPLKTGAARIALGAEARNDYRLGVRIVPVGLTYSDPQRFRSRLLVAFGAPLAAGELAELHHDDERRAVRQLTLRLQRRLEALVLNLPSATVATMLADLREFYADELLEDERVAEDLPEGMAGEMALSRRMRGAVTYFCRTAPELAEEMHRKLGRYNRLVERLRVRRQALLRAGERSRATEPRRARNALGTGGRRPMSVLRGGVGSVLLGGVGRSWRLALAGAGALPAAYGLLLNWLPYQTTRWIARRYHHRETFVATVKFLAGGLLFGAWYGTLGLVTWRTFGPVPALAFVATLPFAGLWTLTYRDMVQDVLAGWREALLKRRNRRVVAGLRRRRRLLLAELDRWRQHYVSALERERRVDAPGGGSPEPAGNRDDERPASSEAR